MKSPTPSAPDRIILLMLGGIGDILATTPTMRAIRRSFPAAHIVLGVRRPFAPLLEPGNLIDETAHYPAGVRNKIKWALALRRRRFDLYVDLHTPTFNTVTSNSRVFARNGMIARLIGAKARIGYRTGLNRLALTAGPISRKTDTTTPVVELTLGLLPTLDIPRPEVVRKEVFFSDDDEAIAATLRPANPNGYACIHAGCNQKPNLWPAAHFATVINHLHSVHKIAIVLIGGEADKAENASIRALLPASLPVTDLAGKTTLRQTAAMIAKARIQISLDSGPMHMADAAGIPLVAIFTGHNFPGLWHPVNPRGIALRGNAESPARAGRSGDQRIRYAAVNPEAVIEAVDILLKTGPPA